MCGIYIYMSSHTIGFFGVFGVCGSGGEEGEREGGMQLINLIARVHTRDNTVVVVVAVV